MVKISFKPCEEVIIHEHQRFAPQDMIRLRCTGMQVGSIAPNLQWAEGLVMWRETFSSERDDDQGEPRRARALAMGRALGDVASSSR